MKKCQFCGFEIKKYTGCLNTDTIFNNKPVHRGCLEKYLLRLNMKIITIEEDIKFLFKHATKGTINSELLNVCIYVIEKQINTNSEINLSTKTGELWQQLQDFKIKEDQV